MEPVFIAQTELPAASKRPSFDASLRKTPVVPFVTERIAALAGALDTMALNTRTGNSSHTA
jgi:hypothetical protein